MENIIQDWGLWGLFLSAFISSTLLPGGSEALFVFLLTQAQHSPIQLLIAASLGNTLGGLSSWGIGWFIARRYSAEKLTKESHHRAVARIKRWGSPILLFSWLPFIGDPLCVAAGWLRISFLSALVFIAVGKTLRYGLLWLATGA